MTFHIRCEISKGQAVRASFLVFNIWALTFGAHRNIKLGTRLLVLCKRD